ncbi:MAG: hypothetical protein ABI132_04665 [Rhodanobacteraceae bacterium]
MRTIRIRLDGKFDRVQDMLALLRDMDGVDRVEEIADEGEHLREDSSSAGLSDVIGSDFHDIEVHAMSAAVGERVHDRIVLAARELGLVAEFLDRF